MVAIAADGTPAPQAFMQEFSRHRDLQSGLPPGRIQCMELTPSQPARVLIQGQWSEWQGNTWKPVATLTSTDPNRFRFPDVGGSPIEAPIRADTVLQILHYGPTNYVVTGVDIFRVQQDKFQPLGWPHAVPVTQAAVALTGELYTASSLGVHQFNDRGWNPVRIAGLRHWSHVGLWIFGPGLFFFGVGALQINPLSFGEPIWLVGSVIALVIAGYRCLRWWQTVYPRELAAADSASRAVEWAANGAWSEPDGRTAGTIVTRSNAGGLLRE